MTDRTELRRLLDALPGFALRHLNGGPGGESFSALADEGGIPLSDSGFDAVLLFAEIAALEVPRLLDRLAHMTEARDNARAEVERLSAQVEAVRALHRPDHYFGEPGDADCPHDADYEGPRHFEGEDDMWLCEDTASEESYCAGCPTDWDGEREGYPCPTIRALDGETDRG